MHLVDASNRFLQIIPQHLAQNQISSVRLPGTLLASRYDIPDFLAFDHLVSLTLLNPEVLSALPTMLRRLATARAVSLWYDDEFQFHCLQDQFVSPFVEVTRLQVRCAGAVGNQCVSEQIRCRYPSNTIIKSFIFDSGHYSLRSNRYCSLDPRSCFNIKSKHSCKSMNGKKYSVDARN